MSRFIPCLTAVLLSAFPLVSNGEMVRTSDVVAHTGSGSFNATSAHGVFAKNDNACLALLNGGGTGIDDDDGSIIRISSTGMFSTILDRRAGSAFRTGTWTHVGKSDDSSFGPFTGNPESKTGTLTLDTPFTGNVAISLKSSNAYVVYAFENLNNVSSFTFSTRAIDDGSHELSHAAFFTSTVIPEPTSLITFATVAGLFGLRRRRQA